MNYQPDRRSVDDTLDSSGSVVDPFVGRLMGRRDVPRDRWFDFQKYGKVVPVLKLSTTPRRRVGSGLIFVQPQSLTSGY
jgi:hypothetical protein